MVEPTLVEFETPEDSCSPARPTTPWLLAVQPPPRFAPALAVFRLAPAALPAVLTTLPVVDDTPPTTPPRDGPGAEAMLPPRLPIAIESSPMAAEAAA